MNVNTVSIITTDVLGLFEKKVKVKLSYIIVRSKA